jgi:flagellar basal-body rod modification protein FlgD
MNINSISSASQNSSSLTPATGGAQADSNMFMTLLVAQLKNQDPLEPQDGTAFVAQLAQFNSLDQLIGIRNAMDQLVAAINQLPTPTPTTPNQGEI